MKRLRNLLAITAVFACPVLVPVAHAEEVGTPADATTTQPESLVAPELYIGPGPNVGVLAYCTDLTGIFGADNVADTLSADGRFGTITTIDGDVNPPTAQDLEQFDCVIAMTDNRCGSSSTPSYPLATYAGGGGGVVVSTFGFSTTIGFTAPIFGAGLSPFQTVQGPNAAAGAIDVAGAAAAPPACVRLMSGVTDPVSSSWTNAVTLSPGATLCTEYTNGQDLLAINADGNVVGLNTFPADQSDNTQQSYRNLVANAVAEACRPRVDHYKCYEIEESTELSPAPIVDLEDQFGVEIGVEVGEPEFFCNPVSKDGEDIINPETHLTCYEIESEEDEDRGLEIANQFGVQNLIVDEAELLCVPSRKEIIDLPPGDDDDDDDD